MANPDTAAPNGSAAAIALRVAALADQCVQCGMCLPHCPTYRIGGNEGESPRGRIALARAVSADPRLGSAALDRHLDQCLSCGGCDAACPSQVDYAELISLTRSQRRPRRSALVRVVQRLARQPRLLRLLRAGATALAPLLATRTPWPAFGALLSSLIAARSWPTRAAPEFSPARGTRRGAVALFRGCVAATFDADTQQATSAVLAALGFDVHAPSAAHCCGALERHRGDLAGAARHAAACARVFGAVAAPTVLCSASGCQKDLSLALLGAGRQHGVDVLAFVARELESAVLQARSPALRVVWMMPCSQEPADGAATRAVLRRLDRLELLELPPQPRCCGASGTYYIEHPQLSQRLREERVAQILALAPDRVITGNIGCRLQLQAGLLARGSSVKVQHPIALLAECIQP